MLAIIGDSLYNCLQIDSLSYVTIFVAVDIIQSLANFFLILIMILPLTLTLLRHNYLRVTIPKIVNSIFLGVLAIVGFLSVALVSAENMSLQNTGEDEFPNYLVPFTATYAGLYLAGAIMATGYVLVSLHTMLKYPTEFSGVGYPMLELIEHELTSFAALERHHARARSLDPSLRSRRPDRSFCVRHRERTSGPRRSKSPSSS